MCLCLFISCGYLTSIFGFYKNRYHIPYLRFTQFLKFYKMFQPKLHFYSWNSVVVLEQMFVLFFKFVNFTNNPNEYLTIVEWKQQAKFFSFQKLQSATSNIIFFFSKCIGSAGEKKSFTFYFFVQQEDISHFHSHWMIYISNGSNRTCLVLC